MAEASPNMQPDLPGQVIMHQPDLPGQVNMQQVVLPGQIQEETNGEQDHKYCSPSPTQDREDCSPTQRPPGSAGSASSAGSGKRVAVTSLSGSSSEGEYSDFEDQIPPSPCSSTSSGPIYVRPPGFKHHGQEVQIFTVKQKPSVKLKKKVRRQQLVTDNFVVSIKKEEIIERTTAIPQQHHKQEPQQLTPRNSPRGSSSSVMTKLGITGTKPKPRKEPLPMKLRALPQSFWQQPNAVNSTSPGTMYAVLPPLCKTDQSDLTEVRPVTPPSDTEDIKEKEKDSEKLKTDCNNNNNSSKSKEVTTVPSQEVVRRKPPRPPHRIVKVSPANTDLLCKLFDGVDASDKKKSNAMRRGRPKREPNHASLNKHLTGDDPYITDALPVLSLESSSRQSIAPTSHLSLVSVKSGGRTFTLPSLSVEQNYPAMLSEVVKAL